MTRHRSARTTLGILVTTAAVVALTGSPASARIIDGDSFDDHITGTNTNFCGVAGLDATFDVTVTGRFKVNERAPGGAAYYFEKRRVVNVLTDPATGWTVTDISPNILDKDHSIVDNGDGKTITIVELLTGGNRTLGHDGHLIASNAGQIRLEIVYNYVDETEVSNTLIFGSTGTNDDFCEAVLADWGYN
ncbi:hypothetical protein ISU07_00195 [Nocardioides islandensis]|jgi:hypothetical protein|uniref:Uncharacterized protein n=1 Tax=Nocardioides islandensis TaxID=433663 RepID=A0A930YAZ2_9ACTN|nr:hypothetical protein [Nocardioides islandensis]MBF4761531.1 hypothetical protein [Nocardioides islandensis]